MLNHDHLFRLRTNKYLGGIGSIQQTLNTNDVMTSSEQVKDYLTIQLAGEPDEWFGVMILTSEHRLMSFEKLFRGTVNSSYVHIRVIARKALELNATEA